MHEIGLFIILIIIIIIMIISFNSGSKAYKHKTLLLLLLVYSITLKVGYSLMQKIYKYYTNFTFLSKDILTSDLMLSKCCRLTMSKIAQFMEITVFSWCTRAI